MTVSFPLQASFQFGSAFYFSQRSQSFEAIRPCSPVVSGSPEGQRGRASGADVLACAALRRSEGTSYPVYVGGSRTIFLLQLSANVREQPCQGRDPSGLGQRELHLGLYMPEPRHLHLQRGGGEEGRVGEGEAWSFSAGQGQPEPPGS